jgi:hypothetical protein
MFKGLKARGSKLEAGSFWLMAHGLWISFRVRVHKLTAQLEAQLPAGVSRLLEVRSPRLEGNDSFKVKV